MRGRGVGDERGEEDCGQNEAATEHTGSLAT
jgi:hypothetical protein